MKWASDGELRGGRGEGRGELCYCGGYGVRRTLRGWRSMGDNENVE